VPEPQLDPCLGGAITDRTSEDDCSGLDIHWLDLGLLDLPLRVVQRFFQGCHCKQRCSDAIEALRSAIIELLQHSLEQTDSLSLLLYEFLEPLSSNRIQV